jgi:hypothetical protein
MEYGTEEKKSVLFRPYAKVSGCSKEPSWGCCERWVGDDSETVVKQSDLRMLCMEEIIQPQLLFSNNGYVWATSKGRRAICKERNLFSLVKHIGWNYFWRFAHKLLHWKKQGSSCCADNK